MRWTSEQAWAWYHARPWLCGFNYVPSTAINSTELWQRSTFDPQTIERELAWAHAIGFNCCRVFVQYLVWEDDPAGLLDRMDQFLAVATRAGLATMFVLFDDCAFANREPYLGEQDEPLPGIHNSGWTPSPGHLRVVDQAAWPRLAQYVAEVVGRFAHDPRVLLWDLYNEPGNATMGDRSVPLVEATFRWARSANPSQPLTVGVWAPLTTNEWTTKLGEVQHVAVHNSDVISFHDYNELPATQQVVAHLRTHQRPLLCTEWMRRTYGSHFETHLPYFKQEGIGSFFWGLVNGRTQTHMPWGSAQGALDPQLWFHDLLDGTGTPHQAAEVELIRAQIFGSTSGPSVTGSTM